MNWIRKRRSSPATAIALAALVVALGGVAFAAIPDSNGTIHACYQKQGGQLRVVESADCRSNERPLDWSQNGSGGGSSGQLGPVVLDDGASQVLYTKGPLTFTARCRFDATLPANDVYPERQADVAEILISTTQDHASFYGVTSGSIEDLLTTTDEERRLILQTNFAPEPPEPHLTNPFNAIGPDGTVLNGDLSAGIDLPSNPGKCVFGGFVVAS